MAIKKRKRFQMTIDEKHSHSTLLDQSGNGTSTSNAGHRHEIRGFQVLDSAGAEGDLHSHNILRD